MNVNDIITRAKRQFGDESGVQLTDADIIRWINDAQRDISMKHNLLQTKASSNVVGGQADYSVPADLLNLFGVRYNGQRLVEYSLQEIDLDGLGSNPAETGTPASYSFFANVLTLYPTPVSDLVSGLTIFYTKQPTVITTAADPLTLPESYHNAIVSFVLTSAYEMDENWQAAQFKSAEFNGDMSELKGKLELQPEEFYPHITYSGDYSDDWVY